MHINIPSILLAHSIQPVHPKGGKSWVFIGGIGDKSWVFIGGTDIEAETPILWPPDVESWLIWEDPDAGKDWGQEEKGMTEDEMVGWHHRHNRHGFGWTPGVGDGQWGLACCSSWGHRVGHDWATELNWILIRILSCLLLYEAKCECSVTQSSHVWLFATLWTVARQAPLSMGILQAIILEWIAMPSFRRSSQPRDRTQISHIASGFFYHLSHQLRQNVKYVLNHKAINQ